MRVALAVQAAGAALLGVTGFWALAAGTTAGSGFSGALEPRFGVDGLSAFFLGMLGLVAAPTLAFASGYFEPNARGRILAAQT
jgi:formate hydrogenlyase subunit 3/multisubunit Na+/H+ antiporter MnhD subunit